MGAARAPVRMAAKMASFMVGCSWGMLRRGRGL
jgi:hypothetical protein